MTEKLYYSDSYLKECAASVVKADGKMIVLDKTIFYAQGGGQPFDLGKIISENGTEYNVLGVKQISGEIVHELDREGLHAGEVVKCAIDWERRYKFMRMHTSAHILARCITRDTGALITGNQLDLARSRMDFNSPSFNKDNLPAVERVVNEEIAKNYKISVSFMEREKALADPKLFRLKDVLPKEIPIYRIVAIGDFDIQADGGTHVATTSEIGKFKIVDFANKGAENRRIYWELE